MAGLDSVVFLFSKEEDADNDRRESIPLNWVGIVSFYSYKKQSKVVNKQYWLPINFEFQYIDWSLIILVAKIVHLFSAVEGSLHF